MPSLLLTFFFILLFPCQLFGKSIVIFGHDGKHPKISIKDKRPAGILIEMMQAIGKEMSVEFEFQLSPWVRAFENAKTNTGGIIGFSKTQERMKIFDYSDVMYMDEMLIVVRKGSEFPYQTIKDLSNKQIAVIRGGKFGDKFVNAVKDKTFSILELNNPSQQLRMVLSKRVDAALVGPGKVGVQSAINKDPELAKNADKFVSLSTPFKQDPNYLGFRKTLKMTDFLNKFNQALKKIKDQGIVKKILQKYSNN